MHNIEYLTERDLKYFEKKEALGEAIIIRIEPAMLLSLDLDELFQKQEKDQTLSVEELEDFLYGRKRSAGMQPTGDSLTEGSRAKDPQPADPKPADPSPGEHEEAAIEKNLQNIQLSADKRERLMSLIHSGASDEELMVMLQEDGETV